LARGKEETSTIIHAEGVRGDSQSSAPKVRNPSLSRTMARAAQVTRLPEAAVGWQQ